MRSARADARSRIHRGMLKGITACTRCARPKVPLGTKGVNTCYPVAKVFPSGWNENTSLYTGEKLAGGARERVRFQSRANLSIGCVPRIFHDAELCGANGAQWYTQ